MKHIYTFLATAPVYGIEEDYIWVSEKKGKFWLYKSPDFDNIVILGVYKHHCEKQCCDVIQRMWARSNVFIQVMKVAATAVIENASQ